MPAQPQFMRRAILAALKNLKTLHGGPFGACIVRHGKVISVAANSVLQNDSTCHAEMNAIRLATKKVRRLALVDCEIYSTTEPCPMCFSAIHWAGIPHILYGTTIADVAKRGFNELNISTQVLKRLGKSPIRLTANYRRAECLALLKRWDKVPTRPVY